MNSELLKSRFLCKTAVETFKLSNFQTNLWFLQMKMHICLFLDEFLGPARTRFYSSFFLSSIHWCLLMFMCLCLRTSRTLPHLLSSHCLSWKVELMTVLDRSSRLEKVYQNQDFVSVQPSIKSSSNPKLKAQIFVFNFQDLIDGVLVTWASNTPSVIRFRFKHRSILIETHEAFFSLCPHFYFHSLTF